MSNELDHYPVFRYPACDMKTNNIAKRTSSTLNDPLKEILDVPRPVVALARDYPSGQTIAAHRHSRSQLLYAVSGVMTVTVEKGIWVVPPLRAVWIPAHMSHQIETSGRLSMRSLYIDPAVFSGPADDCCVLSVSPLLRELILFAVTMPRLYPLNGSEERLLEVLFDQIRDEHVAPLNLPIPADKRLKRIYDHLLANPGDKKTLEDWGKTVGATNRTIARLFKAETGMSFGQWRQQIRILEALKRLGMNEPVTTVAIEMGYDSTSAFIVMFKKILGQTPGKYFSP